MPVDADLESEGSTTYGDIAVWEYNDTLDLYRHYFLIHDSAFHSWQVIVALVNFAIVVEDDKSKVAAPLALCHPRFQRSLHAANERIYLVMILLLYESHRIAKDRFQYRLEATLAHFAIDKNFDRVSFHPFGE